MKNNNAIKNYMLELGKVRLLTRAEEVELAGKIADGCEESRDKLITSNLRLVVKIAHDFKNLGLPLVDLIAEGNIGLMRAAEKFDPAKGSKFSSYSAWWIKQAMRRAISNQARTVRIPIQSAKKLSQINGAQGMLSERLGRLPTTKEIADELGYKVKTVNILQHTAVHIMSLQEIIKEDQTGSYQDIMLLDETQIPDNLVCENDNFNQIHHLLEGLDEREQTIIVHRFGLDGEKPWTLDRLSSVVGRTRERVRQIQYTAINKLKKMLDEEYSGAFTVQNSINLYNSSIPRKLSRNNRI